MLFPRNPLAFAPLCLLLVQGGAHGSDAPPTLRELPRKLAVIADSAIDESSGIARSIRNPGKFWTHNDSGDRPRIFLMDDKGKTRAVVNVGGAAAVDWEDIASYERGGHAWVMLADVGNNRLNRNEVTLYVIEEPKVSDKEEVQSLVIAVAMRLTLAFEGGPRNCEGVGVDAAAGKIYLASKETGSCGIYESPLPEHATGTTLPARRIATVPVSIATGLDISPDGRRLVICTYLAGYEFLRGVGEDWKTALSRAPQMVPLPLRRTGEAICYGDDGVSLYLTSEGSKQPLWEIKARKD